MSAFKFYATQICLFPKHDNLHHNYSCRIIKTNQSKMFAKSKGSGRLDNVTDLQDNLHFEYTHQGKSIGSINIEKIDLCRFKSVTKS